MLIKEEIDHLEENLTMLYIHFVVRLLSPVVHWLLQRRYVHFISVQLPQPLICSRRDLCVDADNVECVHFVASLVLLILVY